MTPLTDDEIAALREAIEGAGCRLTVQVVTDLLQRALDEIEIRRAPPVLRLREGADAKQVREALNAATGSRGMIVVDGRGLIGAPQDQPKTREATAPASQPGAGSEAGAVAVSSLDIDLDDARLAWIDHIAATATEHDTVCAPAEVRALIAQVRRLRAENETLARGVFFYEESDHDQGHMKHALHCAAARDHTRGCTCGFTAFVKAQTPAYRIAERVMMEKGVRRAR